jgi:hypothetical protein
MPFLSRAIPLEEILNRHHRFQDLMIAFLLSSLSPWPPRWIYPLVAATSLSISYQRLAASLLSNLVWKQRLLKRELYLSTNLERRRKGGG